MLKDIYGLKEWQENNKQIKQFNGQGNNKYRMESSNPTKTYRSHLCIL